MNTSHTPLPYEDEPVPQEVKPHRLVVRSVQVWGLFCAAMFLLALVMEAMRLRQNPNPVRWREIVAWVSFDALFFLALTPPSACSAAVSDLAKPMDSRMSNPCRDSTPADAHRGA